MIKITKVLPGELEDDVDPEEFGFDVVSIEEPNEVEAAERIYKLYAQVKERTGVVIPKLEDYLASVAGRQETGLGDN